MKDQPEPTNQRTIVLAMLIFFLLACLAYIVFRFFLHRSGVLD